eukprot:3220069-Pleurochrysis_carterae.AAC.1
MIDLSSIDEMQTIVVSGDSTTASISIGAATPLAVLLRTADELGATASLKDGHRWRAVAAHLKRVANHQVRAALIVSFFCTLLDTLSDLVVVTL